MKDAEAFAIAALAMIASAIVYRKLQAPAVSGSSESIPGTGWFYLDDNAAAAPSFVGDGYTYTSEDFVGPPAPGDGQVTTETGEGGSSIVEAAAGILYKVAGVWGMATGSRMATSLAGMAHVIQWEGVGPGSVKGQFHVPYKDQGGLWTIGYGHLLKPGEWWDRIDEAQAMRLLAEDLNVAEDVVNALVRVPLTQPQFDALVSFAYNAGTGAFRSSTMLRKLNAGDATVVNEFGRWVYVSKGGKLVRSEGLANRRVAEAKLYQGNYA